MDCYARLFHIAGSDLHKVETNTLLYDWSYEQFLPLETYVLFQNDRKQWHDKQQEVDNAED